MLPPETEDAVPGVGIIEEDDDEGAFTPWAYWTLLISVFDTNKKHRSQIILGLMDRLHGTNSGNVLYAAKLTSIFSCDRHRHSLRVYVHL